MTWVIIGIANNLYTTEGGGQCNNKSIKVWRLISVSVCPPTNQLHVRQEDPRLPYTTAKRELRAECLLLQPVLRLPTDDPDHRLRAHREETHGTPDLTGEVGEDSVTN